MDRTVLLLIAHILLFCSCKSQSREIEVIKKTVLTEIDTFITSTGKVNLNKSDYFLVRGDINDKKVLKTKIDSFIRNNANSDCKSFTNYMMYFYRESTEVNEGEIKKTDSIYRYKIFIYNRDNDFIASCSCWNGFPSSNISFQPQYKE